MSIYLLCMDSSSYHCWTNNSWLIHLSPFCCVFFNKVLLGLHPSTKPHRLCLTGHLRQLLQAFKPNGKNPKKTKKQNATWLPCEASPKMPSQCRVKGLWMRALPKVKILPQKFQLDEMIQKSGDDPSKSWKICPKNGRTLLAEKQNSVLEPALSKHQTFMGSSL